MRRIAAAIFFAMAVAAAMSLWYAGMNARAQRFAVVTGKAYRPRLVALGWRAAIAWTLIGLYFLLSKIMPIAVLVWSSLQKFYSVPSWQAVQNLTIQPYLTVLNFPSVGTAVWNSFILAIGAATTNSVGGAVVGGLLGAVGGAIAGTAIDRNSTRRGIIINVRTFHTTKEDTQSHAPTMVKEGSKEKLDELSTLISAAAVGQHSITELSALTTTRTTRWAGS